MDEQPSSTVGAEEEARAPHVTSRLAERIGRRYLGYFLLVPLLGYFFPFAAERVAPLNQVFVSRWGHILDYSYGLRGEDADVVVFGDSSAVFSLDTARLSRELGMKVINLPGSMGSLPITGDLALRSYLAVNRPPRLIVFYFAPWDLDFMSSKNSLAFEGEEQILRHQPLSAVLRLVRGRTKDMALFPFRFYASPSEVRDFFNGVQPVEIVQGHTPDAETSPLKDSCSLPVSSIGNPKASTVEQLVREFSSAQTRTLVYLAPLPDCQHAAEVAAMRYPGVNAAAPLVLPHREFANDEFYVHPLAESVPRITDLLEGAIKDSLGK